MIRVAGNILDKAILGSIEYAVEHLGVQLIVLGHESCGAVSATVQEDDGTGICPQFLKPPSLIRFPSYSDTRKNLCP